MRCDEAGTVHSLMIDSLSCRLKHNLVFPVIPPTKVQTLVVANLMGGLGGLCESDDCKDAC